MTVELAAQTAGQLTSKCNTFVKVDTQIEDNCRRTISYLQGCSYPKIQLQEIDRVIKNLRRLQFAVQEEQLYAVCGARLNKLLFIKVTVYFSFSFRKKSQQSTINIYGNLLPVFSIKGSSLEEK